MGWIGRGQSGNVLANAARKTSTQLDNPGVTAPEQGAVGDFYDLRAFSVFAVPTGTPKEIVERLSSMLIEGGSDPRVRQMLDNFLLSSPADLQTTARVFKRDSDVMLGILRDLGVKPLE